MPNLKNLDEVERYIKENMPDWRLERGQIPNLRVYEGKTAGDYEVINLYSPENELIAEFWRGYYASFPNEYTGIYQMVCKGDLNSAMRSVIREARIA